LRLSHLLLTVLILTLASTVSADEASNSASTFPVDTATTLLNTVSKSIGTSPEADKSLYASIQTLKKYQTDAEKCVDNGKNELDKIDALLNDKQVGGSIHQNAADYQYLVNVRTNSAKQVAACKVFLYRYDQILAGYIKSLQQQKSTIVPKRVTPVWNILNENIIKQFTISPTKIYENIGIESLSLNNIIQLSIVTILSLFVATLIFKLTEKSIQVDIPNQRLSYYAAIVIRRFIFILLPLACICLFLTTSFYAFTIKPIIVSICYAFLIYTFLLAIMNFILFIPKKNVEGIMEMNSVVRKYIFFRFSVVITIILIGYVGAMLLQSQELSQQFIDILRLTFTTALLLAVFWLCWVVFKMPYLLKRKKNSAVTLSKIIYFLTLMTLIAFEWMGYYDITLYILKSAILSILFMLVMWGITIFIDRAFAALDDESGHFSSLLSHYSNIKSNIDIFELSLLKASIYFLLIGVFIIGLMYVWDASPYYIDVVKSALLHGFPLFGINIKFLPILAGLMSFSVISLIGKIIAANMAKRHHVHRPHENQVAIASIFSYLMFTFALLTGLLISGVSFTGLAIIAGALSVGIGFGFQNIVNNFICGIILLIQRPVKSGDRVLIGDKEGFVTRIRVLSTYIRTVKKEDVIIPNSDLIFKPLINYMFRDSYILISNAVGVAYGSDTELVTKLLMEIAQHHPDVIQDEANKPSVFFKSFGDSTLCFELWCVINDVNKKFQIISELNYAINNEFRKNNVVIAYPQQDIYIKEIPPITPESK